MFSPPCFAPRCWRGAACRARTSTAPISSSASTFPRRCFRRSRSGLLPIRAGSARRQRRSRRRGRASERRTESRAGGAAAEPSVRQTESRFVMHRTKVAHAHVEKPLRAAETAGAVRTEAGAAAWQSARRAGLRYADSGLAVPVGRHLQLEAVGEIERRGARTSFEATDRRGAAGASLGTYQLQLSEKAQRVTSR